jgi:tRNA pseudouridine(38-40) synthase
MALRSPSLRSIAKTKRFFCAAATGNFAPETVTRMTTESGVAGGDDDNTVSASTVHSPRPPMSNGKRRRILEKKKVALNRKGRKSKMIMDWGDDESEGGGRTCQKRPHPGSYANSSQRERFGIRVPDEYAGVRDDRNGGEAAVAASLANDEQPLMTQAKRTTKRKYALLFGYCGSSYGGFQMNEGQKTIQAELELALLRSGLILPTNFGYPWKYGWSVSGRTDKGVHAAGQVFSCKLEVVVAENETANAAAPAQTTTLDDIRHLINGQLPPFMEVLDVARTTRNFCAKTQRHRARYQYLVPSFLLHDDLASLFESSVQEPDLTVPTLRADSVEHLQSRLGSYRASPRQLERLRVALGEYQGTHTFHNFTKGMAPLEDRSRRFIESFQAHDPILLSNVEWIPTTVIGQSFLLHQIRKMIGMAVRVARGGAAASSSSNVRAKTTTIDDLRSALSSPDSLRVPTAPAQGLFLDMSMYDGYNHRRGLMKQDQEMHLLDIAWGREDDEESPACERYRSFRDRIVQHIGREEKEAAHFLQYLFREHRTADSHEAVGTGLSHGEAGPSSDSDEGDDDGNSP